MEAELFHADGRTDMTNLPVPVRNFAKAPKDTAAKNSTVTATVWKERYIKTALLQLAYLATPKTLLSVMNFVLWFPNLSPVTKQLMIQTETFQAVAMLVSNVNTAHLSQPGRIICF